MGNQATKPSNKSMVDQLVELSHHINSPGVEGVFRAVDRALYFDIEEGEAVDPYDDEPWRRGNLHLSAPCIYAKVVEALDLRSGLSFLNLGSGTGYLNTIVGLLIGPNGLNHGIEIHKDVVDYANKRLEYFKGNSCAIYKYDFSEPTFFHANCLNLNPDTKYDRIYLGAACLQNMETFMKKLVKPNGGILVMPYNGHLVRYVRTGDETWIDEILMNVNFTDMIGREDRIDEMGNISNGIGDKMIDMPRANAKSLKELCRTAITQQLRHKTNLMNPNLLHSDNVDRRRHRRAMATLAMRRVEEQRQADAIRAQKAAAAAAASTMPCTRTRPSVAARKQAKQRHHNNRRHHHHRHHHHHHHDCCRGIRGQHPLVHNAHECRRAKSLQATASSCEVAPRSGESHTATTTIRPSTSSTCEMPLQQLESSGRVLTRSARRQLQVNATEPCSSTSASIGTAVRPNADSPASNSCRAITTKRESSHNLNNCQVADSNNAARSRRSSDSSSEQVHQPRFIHHSSPWFAFGSGGVNGRLVHPNELPYLGRAGPGGTARTFNWSAISAFARQRLSSSNNLSQRPSGALCCSPSDIGARSRPLPTASSWWRRMHCLASGSMEQHVLEPHESTDDGEEDDGGLSSSSSFSSSSISWSSESNSSNLSGQQLGSPLSELSAMLDSDDSGDGAVGSDMVEQVISEINDEDDNDEDEQSSLGESWDSFLVDANGDNADTSDDDDDDGDYSQFDHAAPTRSLILNSSARRECEDSQQSPERPVSSRLRSSSGGSRTQALAVSPPPSARPVPTLTRSCQYDTSHSRACDRHVMRRGLRPRTSGRSREGGDMVASRRYPHQKFKRHQAAHKCRWHQRREQQLAERYPNVVFPLCSAARYVVAQQASSTASDRIDELATRVGARSSAPPQSLLAPGSVDDSTQAKMRLRIRNWLALDAQPASSIRLEPLASSSSSQIQHQAAPAGGPKSPNLANKRKRQTSSSSSSSSDSVSMTEGELAETALEQPRQHMCRRHHLGACRRHAHLRHYCRHHRQHHQHRCSRCLRAIIARSCSKTVRHLHQAGLRDMQTRRRVERRERRNSRRAINQVAAAAAALVGGAANQDLGQDRQRAEASVRGSRAPVAANGQVGNRVDRGDERGSNQQQREAVQSQTIQKQKQAKKPRANECEKYRNHISGYIRQLPLPQVLRDFLNYDRSF